MRGSVISITIVYCILAISTKLLMFYGDHYNSPIGRLSPFILLALILPSVLTAAYLKRKQNGGFLGGKEAVREGLLVVSIIAVIMTIFDYIFFELEMKEFYINFFKNVDYKELLAEKLKHEKTAKLYDVVKQQMMYEKGFTNFSISRAIFPIFAFGLFSSFIAGVFMKRSAPQNN